MAMDKLGDFLDILVAVIALVAGVGTLARVVFVSEAKTRANEKAIAEVKAEAEKSMSVLRLEHDKVVDRLTRNIEAIDKRQESLERFFADGKVAHFELAAHVTSLRDIVEKMDTKLDRFFDRMSR